MNKSILAISLIPLIALSIKFGYAQMQPVDLKRLPAYPLPATVAGSDWLTHPPTQEAALYRTQDGHLAISNGLITRIFSTNPGGATVGMDNLMTGQSLLRSVSPEAVLYIDGHELSVGGLIGQPIANYLATSWIPKMRPDPASLKLTGVETAPLTERFAWQPRHAWISRPIAQPNGLTTTFTYRADEATIKYHLDRLAGDQGRQLLFEDHFRSLSDAWSMVSANDDPRFTFVNEGKWGQILAPAQHPVYAERTIPTETETIIAQISVGTDRSGLYGPGLTLVYPDGRHLRIFLDQASGQIGINGYGGMRYFPGLDASKATFIRINLDRDSVRFGTSVDGTTYRTLAAIPANSFPSALRIGKTDPSGGASAGLATDTMGRCKIGYLALLGRAGSPASDMDFLAHLTVRVHYALYDGLPLLSKWVTVSYDGPGQVIINNLRSEQLAVVEAESAVEHKQRWELPPLFAQSDFAFGSMSPNASENAGVVWQTDTTYTTQVNYALQTPTLLVCQPPNGIGQEVDSNTPFESMRLWELFYDSDDRERRGLAQRRMYRTLAPWVQENPMIMHVRSADDASVKKAIDQCADVGFEMVIMTFGSGFNIEDTTAYNIGRMKALRDYAHQKGIALGGYSLLASRSIDRENDVVMPAGRKPTFGNSPCLLSDWGNRYFETLYRFYEATGMDILEHDGSYPGDVCASCDHPGHRGLEDSQWKQFARIREFYRWCRGRGIYLNVPDWYFLQGSSKIAMGYRETNWSLPREYQEIIERQNIYDGTWEKTPSMGWMFVPLVEYHGGGPAATIEPLKDHLDHYEQRLANLFGAGVQACFRGPQLYDAPATRALVKKWVDLYKRHRRILDSDIIHIRRPDGRDYDGMLHVDPHGDEKGFLMLYNPLDTAITRTLAIDLYYTGLVGRASIAENGAAWQPIELDGTILRITLQLPAKGYRYVVVKAAE